MMLGRRTLFQALLGLFGTRFAPAPEVPPSIAWHFSDDTISWGAVDSAFIEKGILQTDMLATGIGIHLFGEPADFTTIAPRSDGPIHTYESAPWEDDEDSESWLDDEDLDG